jgi:hypothetical protein
MRHMMIPAAKERPQTATSGSAGRNSLAPVELRSIGQVERLVRANIDPGGLHRLTIGERPVQIDVAIVGLWHVSAGAIIPH